ncbi:MAG TPA: hypothetical protein VGR53_00505 [Nitrososphaerales archaeon]|nr:hypothetical protein [Nitrososphaerales archaeon]
MASFWEKPKCVYAPVRKYGKTLYVFFPKRVISPETDSGLQDQRVKIWCYPTEEMLPLTIPVTQPPIINS